MSGINIIEVFLILYKWMKVLQDVIYLLFID